MPTHYLIRHTKPNIQKGICYGNSDIDLVKPLEKKFEMVRSKLPSIRMKFFSSPLKRCSKLAEFLCDNVQFDSRLQEMNFGKWELKKWEQIPKDEISPWYEDYIHVSPPHGENFNQLYQRVYDFFDLSLRKEQEPCCIVAHAGPIRILKGIEKKFSLVEMMDIKISYGEVITVQF